MSVRYKMPRKSNRKILLEKIIANGVFNTIWAKSLSETDKELLISIENYATVLNFRYFGPRMSHIPKSKDWYLHILPTYDDNRFQSSLRVSRANFSQILSLICDSPPFQLQAKKMLSVETQLAVALYRFGCDGAGVSYWKVGHQFGISDCGMIKNATTRVIKALLLLEKQFIHWPTPNERKNICQFMEDRLPGCIGYLDGCHIQLYEAPVDNHESYFSRKQVYAIQLQAVCDNNLAIRGLTIGFPASVHDSRIFDNSPIGQNPQRFLSDGEWLAADSAYKLTTWVLTPFRDNSNHGTAQQRKAFNVHFSGYRVKIEQTFGILKKVFGSLRGLRIRVYTAKGHKRACDWILACCILYNIVKPVEEMEIQPEENIPFEGQNSLLGENKRQNLFNWINKL